jgi:hypothetical protein
MGKPAEKSKPENKKVSNEVTRRQRLFKRSLRYI